LPSDRFSFEGFLPAKSGARLKKLSELVSDSRTLIFYESPHRVVESLADIATVFGDEREAVLARELTKAFETFLVGNLDEIRRTVVEDPNQQRGEIVLLVRGAPESASGEDQEEQLRVLKLLMAELPLKQAAALAAKITGGQKNALYQLALSLKE
jgi:16S rRNA (cytidine1402-2'-O)-methyltransferase